MYLSLHRVLDRGQAADPQFVVPPHEKVGRSTLAFQVVFLHFVQKHSGPASSHGLPSRCLPGPALR
jgi:hypothetical protein